RGRDVRSADARRRRQPRAVRGAVRDRHEGVSRRGFLTQRQALHAAARGAVPRLHAEGHHAGAAPEFYRNPGPAMTKGWYKSTPPEFLFAMKMPKRITHEKKLKGVAENLGWFYASAKELREKCGPLVAQLPPSIKFDSHWVVMQEFLRALEVDKYPHAIEFRHKSWFRDDVYKLLRDRNVTRVWSENQYLRTPTDVTSDQVYLRMVGDREITEFKEVQKDKSAEMRTWYKELEESSDSVKGALVFFNNHYAGFGPGSVNEFRRLAGMMEYQ